MSAPVAASPVRMKKERATVSAPDGAIAGEGGAASFKIERIDGAAEVLAAIADRPDLIAKSAFQTRAWLNALLGQVAPARHAEACLLIVREAASDAPVMALALMLRTEAGLCVAELADLGLSDYCAPIINASRPVVPSPVHAAALYRAVLGALPEADLVCFEKMPLEICGRTNLLALHPAAVPSRFNGNWLTVTTTVEDYVASRGKKYRKEAERSRRRLEDMGEVRFARAATPEEIDSAYQQLEVWQADRHRKAGHDYGLAVREVSRFYHVLLRDTANSGEASLYTLHVGGELAAVLLGVTSPGRFTLVRIADGGEKWRQCSPGRMIVLEAMRDCVARGIRTFDLGIGDYPFKRWIGCQSVPLVDVAIARSWRARPALWTSATMRRLRNSPRLRALVSKIKQLRRPGSASG